jgi:phosphoglycolate phosphatase
VQVADDHPSKPHPAMLEACLAETGVDASNATMIGDTTYDIEMGRAAGSGRSACPGAITRSSALREAGADDVIDDFAALHSLLGRGLQTHDGLEGETVLERRDRGAGCIGVACPA